MRNDNSKKITAGKCSINPVALRWHINLCSASCHCVEAGTGAIAYPNRFDSFCEQQKLSQHPGPHSPPWASCIIISVTSEIYFKFKVGWIKARNSINNRIPFPLILKNDWGVGKDKLVKKNSTISPNCWRQTLALLPPSDQEWNVFYFVKYAVQETRLWRCPHIYISAIVICIIIRIVFFILPCFCNSH